MNTAEIVHVEAVEVAGRLNLLAGLKETSLRAAVLYGMQFVAECTKLDPPYVSGIVGSGKVVRALRESLIPNGWAFSNSRNYATTIEPGGTFAIAVAGGDFNTGSHQTPSTRAEKGPATRDAIYGNNQSTFSDIDAEFPRTQVRLTMQTWLLLYFFDERANEVRMELSLPGGMDGEGYVTRWKERIILTPAELGALSVTVAATDVEPSETIDVPVAKKAAV